MKKFKIIHRFPNIDEVENNLKTFNSVEAELEILKDESEAFSGADGNTLIDVLIYFEKHWEEMLLYPGVYDVLKGSLVLLWLKVSKRFKKSESHNMDRNHQIEISFKRKKDGEIKFNLHGDLDGNQIDNIMESLLKLASSEQQADELFSNPDLIDENDEKPSVRMRYNMEKNRWEPVNIKKI
jgi:hypothetical protein